MRIGYLDCFSGISGDMLLGALVDAGVPFETLAETAAALDVGARLQMRKVSRGGIAGTKVDVLTAESVPSTSQHKHEHDAPQERTHTHEQEHGHTPTHEHGTGHSHEHEHSHEQAAEAAHKHSHAPHRSLTTILKIIREAPLSDGVKDLACRAFELLGEAESAIHQIPIETVHFHEVGAVDTIVDIVCTAVGCAVLGVDRWMCSPLNVGSGTVECAHGTLPVPAPATLALLGDAPVYAAGPAMERVTPTGAAILRMLQVQYGSLPAMRIARSGYGAGGRDTPGQPNLVRLLVGEESVALEIAAEPIAIIETVIDDSSPQLIAYVSELLLEAGAWDVYRAGVQMKKGRAGVQLTVLCHPDRAAAVRELIFRETTTIGLHWRVEQKASLAREFTEVQTPWGPVQIKIARWATSEVANAAPEYEDCRALARRHSVPLKQVMQAAMRAYTLGHAKKEIHE
ncbi:MAG TPA: nickel pincer cofactor biosynthesis protein LarC [Terracidiphilus sp.]|jgi:uncharacterized protein (TIGR00299 family) protein|nr:nickel pincer cofactor biosynthesis protein LarC [Terracidiphilus sp.]